MLLQIGKVLRSGSTYDFDFDPFFGQELLDFLSGVHWSIVLVEHLVTRAKVRPFLTKSFQELLQGNDDIVHVHVGTPGMWFV